MEKEKIVLDSCIVKDLIQYHKDKQPKFNNGIDIKGVYDYITNLEFDGVSKCYVTIYSTYEILKDFKDDYNENFFIFKTILYPQIITTDYARSFIYDAELINLDEQDKITQQKVMNNLRSLIVDLYSGIFGDIFMGVLLSFMGILEKRLRRKDSRLKIVKNNIKQIHSIIRTKLNKEIGEYLKTSKRQTILYLDKEYVKIMKLVSCMIDELNKAGKVNYKILNKCLIIFINTLRSNEYELTVNDGSNILHCFLSGLRVITLNIKQKKKCRI